MVRILGLAFVASIITSAFGIMQFINPPPNGKEGDFSNSVTYYTGSTIAILWTPADQGTAVSVVLWQLNSTDGQWFGDMEYLTKGAVSVTRYDWLVGTRKNLTTSKLFYLSLFQEGKGGPADANSHYFYLDSKDAILQSMSPTSPSPSSSASTLSTSLQSKTASASTMITTSPSGTSSTPSTASPGASSTNQPSMGSSAIPQATPTPAASNGFPLAAKVGIGAGIPAALAIGLGVGFLLFRRRKRKDTTYQVHQATAGLSFVPDERRYHNNDGFYGSNLNEAPPKSPVEMAQRQRDSYYTHQYERNKDQPVPTRYEM